MKKWILMIFRIGPLISRLADKLDEKIEKTALDPFGPTSKQYEKILELSDKKRRLINLKVLRDLLMKELTPDEVFLIGKYSSGLTVREIADAIGRKESTTYKRLAKALSAAAAVLTGVGFDEKRLSADYGEFPVIASALRLFAAKCK